MPTIENNRRKASNGRNKDKAPKGATLTIEQPAPAVVDAPALIPEIVPGTPANDPAPVAMLKFTAYQDGDTFTGVELEAVISDTTARAVIGNVLNALYGWVRLQRKFKTGAFKWNQPINVRFTLGGNVWDTGAMAATYKQRLKLTDTAESRANFAGCFYELYKVTTAKATPVSFDDFYSGLLAESQDAKAARAAKMAAKSASLPAA